jgi:hypothetical protein
MGYSISDIYLADHLVGEMELGYTPPPTTPPQHQPPWSNMVDLKEKSIEKSPC